MAWIRSLTSSSATACWRSTGGQLVPGATKNGCVSSSKPSPDNQTARRVVMSAAPATPNDAQETLRRRDRLRRCWPWARTDANNVQWCWPCASSRNGRRPSSPSTTPATLRGPAGQPRHGHRAHHPWQRTAGHGRDQRAARRHRPGRQSCFPARARPHTPIHAGSELPVGRHPRRPRAVWPAPRTITAFMPGDAAIHHRVGAVGAHIDRAPRAGSASGRVDIGDGAARAGGLTGRSTSPTRRRRCAVRPGGLRPAPPAFQHQVGRRSIPTGAWPAACSLPFSSSISEAVLATSTGSNRTRCVDLARPLFGGRAVWCPGRSAPGGAGASGEESLNHCAATAHVPGRHLVVPDGGAGGRFDLVDAQVQRQHAGRAQHHLGSGGCAAPPTPCAAARAG